MNKEMVTKEKPYMTVELKDNPYKMSFSYGNFRTTTYSLRSMVHDVILRWSNITDEMIRGLTENGTYQDGNVSVSLVLSEKVIHVVINDEWYPLCPVIDVWIKGTSIDDPIAFSDDDGHQYTNAVYRCPDEDQPSYYEFKNNSCRFYSSDVNDKGWAEGTYCGAYAMFRIHKPKRLGEHPQRLNIAITGNAFRTIFGECKIIDCEYDGADIYHTEELVGRLLDYAAKHPTLNLYQLTKQFYARNTDGEGLPALPFETILK